MVQFAIQAAVTVIVVMLAVAVIEILRRRGFDPVGTLATAVSRRDASGLPVASEG